MTGSLVALALTLALIPSGSRLARADDDSNSDAQPSWYKKQQQDRKKKADEAAKKAAEKPVISNDATPSFSELSSATPKPPPPHLLFKEAGLTDSATFDYGYLSQQQINGLVLSGQYALGWWWTPELVFGFYGRISGDWNDEYLWFLFQVGPQIRWFFDKNWELTLNLGWGVSEGLSRVAASHIPTPPDSTELGARNGPIVGLQIGRLGWSKRDLAIGPMLGVWFGKQDERTFTMITLGITFQDGKPDYSGGDLTQK
jgi:hypothetical protein